MSRERYAYAVASHSVSARSLFQRAWALVLLLAMLGLLVLAKMQHPAAHHARTQLLGVVEPALNLVNQPVTSTRNLLRHLAAYHHAVEENAALRAENDRLRHWQSVAMELRAENDRLRSLAHYQPALEASYVTARVTSQSPQNYTHSLTLNAGAADGLAALQPVIDEAGLVGRISDVAPHSARVMLLSDIGSNIPVVTSQSQERAMVSGTGENLLRLSFVHGNPEAIALGETVRTSAVGDLIPGGIAVGQIFKKDAHGYLVKPMRPLTQPDYVRVVLVAPR